MKKIVYLFIISCILIISCVSTDKKENAQTEVQPVEETQSASDEQSPQENDESREPEENQENELETIAQEEDIQTNESLEEENNQQEEEFEEKITAGYEEERVSEDEINQDIKTDAEKTSAPQTAAAKPDIKTNTTAPAAPKTQPVQTPKAQIEKPQETQIKQNSFDLQNELSQVSDKVEEPEEEKLPEPSRTAEIKNHQFLDIKYQGTGWIYLGEVEKQNLLVFYGRKVVDGNTIFTLQSKKSGTATLHFYKNDTLSQKYIDDYMTVNVDTESATDNNHELAPDYASIVPPKPEKVVKEVAVEAQEESPVQQQATANTPEKPEYKVPEYGQNSEPDINTKTRISNSDSEENQVTPQFIQRTPQKTETEPASPQTELSETDGQKDLLDQAREAYNEKQYEKALDLLKSFFISAASRIDEGLYLKGQVLEADSSVQDIKESIDSYETVVNKWPQSRFWKKAKERSIYLRRFYIDIR